MAQSVEWTTCKRAIMSYGAQKLLQQQKAFLVKEKVLCCKVQLIHEDWLQVLCSSAKYGKKFMKLLAMLV